jgi:hypothetical protein
VVFFKTVAPVEPVSFIHKICEDAMAEPMRKRTRTAKRLAPMTLMGKATMEGLESVARDVLAPHFHQAPVTAKKVSLIVVVFASDCSAVHCIGWWRFRLLQLGCDVTAVQSRSFASIGRSKLTLMVFCSLP